EALIANICIELPWIWLSSTLALSISAAPACQRTDPGLALVAYEVISVISIKRTAVIADKSRQFQSRAKLDEHVLERTNIAVRLYHRMPYRIRRPVRIADGTIEQRNAVPSFQISC